MIGPPRFAMEHEYSDTCVFAGALELQILRFRKLWSIYHFYVHGILLQILGSRGDPIIPAALRFILSEESICIIVLCYWYVCTILGNRDICAPHGSSWHKYTPGTWVSLNTMKHIRFHMIFEYSQFDGILFTWVDYLKIFNSNKLATRDHTGKDETLPQFFFIK